VARHVEKFHDVSPPKVMGAHTLNSKQIFECSLLKIVRRTPVPGEVCASKPWPLCKNLTGQHPSPTTGAEIWSSEKVYVGRSKLTTMSNFYQWIKVHRTFFAKRGRDRCRYISFPISDVSILSGDIRGRNLKLSEIASNFARFWLRDSFFLGGCPRISEPRL